MFNKSAVSLTSSSVAFQPRINKVEAYSYDIILNRTNNFNKHWGILTNLDIPCYDAYELVPEELEKKFSFLLRLWSKYVQQIFWYHQLNV